MWNKIRYIFDKRQKRNLAVLLVVITIGAFFELVGVSAVLPLVKLVTEPDLIESSIGFKKIGEILKINTVNQFIILVAAGLIIVYIIKNAYLILMYNLQYRYTYNNQRRIAKRLMECYMKQDYSYHLHNSSAELMRNINTDVVQFFYAVLNALQLITELITCFMLIIFLAIQDLLTTLGIVIVISVFLGVFYVFFKKHTLALGIENRRLAGLLNKYMLQAFEGIKETKVFNKENFFIEQYDKTYEAYSRVAKTQGLFGVIPKPIIESVCICGLLSVLAMRICLGGKTDSFVPMLSVFAVSAFRMLPSFNRITAYLNCIIYYKSSVEAVYQDMKEAEQLLFKTDKQEGELDIKLNDSIQITDVFFRYPDSENNVLEGITFKIPKYHSIALIGQSGAGKTTLADLILGLLTPISGKITVDGINIHEFPNSWHKNLGYIPQTIYLLDDTIANNIAYGNEQIDQKWLWKAIREAQLEKFIEELPEGINTVVGERGVRLSGGQRQRIGIARALYCNPSILILDEATSALDNDTEKAVMDAINNLQGKKTIIVIAHRLSTIKNCDEIYEVREGVIVQRMKDEVL